MKKLYKNLLNDIRENESNTGLAESNRQLNMIKVSREREMNWGLVESSCWLLAKYELAVRERNRAHGQFTTRGTTNF